MDLTEIEKKEILKDILPIEYDLIGEQDINRILRGELKVNKNKADGGYNFDLSSSVDLIIITLSILANVLAIIASIKAISTKEKKEELIQNQINIFLDRESNLSDVDRDIISKGIQRNIPIDKK